MFMYQVLREHMFLVLLELLGHTVTLFVHFEKQPNCFLNWRHPFTILPIMYEDYNFSSFLSTLIIISLVLVILVGVKWYVIVVFICISLMRNDVEPRFMYLLSIYMSSFGKCLFQSFDHLKDWVMCLSIAEL